MKYDFYIQELDARTAVDFIQARHYSKVMPRLTKHYLGIYDGDILAGVLTLGWGTQPYNTIHKLFPSLGSKDYYEIGKMCMDDSYPRNSETQMLSKVFKWFKLNCPEENALFSGKEKIFWLTDDFMAHKNIKRIKGKQFRYIHPLSNEAKKLMATSTVKWTKNYPKEEDLKWKIKTGYKKYEPLESMPWFDLSVVNVNKANVNSHKEAVCT
mgnify:CR=1 FL=1